MATTTPSRPLPCPLHGEGLPPCSEGVGAGDRQTRPPTARCSFVTQDRLPVWFGEDLLQEQAGSASEPVSQCAPAAELHPAPPLHPHATQHALYAFKLAACRLWIGIWQGAGVNNNNVAAQQVDQFVASVAVTSIQLAIFDACGLLERRGPMLV